ncbi:MULTISPECIES: methyltransferase [unclassified Crossiella]|uniref:methyltransferase n=1 Tax=unclassified Crossiella TaxID=2620835 RepID=UPI001FFFC267|nr:MULTISPECIES: methyltransferase [unclassified Crossiella]MCK2242098.1 methyltransferase [Crossiella sp. S99.2]MCK2256001.1 methyltransferase [Crossiella sp. S99.1]
MRSEADIPRFFELADLVTPMVLRVAATLRLAEHVQEGAGTVEELAERTGCVPRVLGKIMDHLVALEIFDWNAAGSLELTPLGLPLLPSWEDGSFRAFLDLDDVAGRAEMSITGLLHTARTGRTAYEGERGRTLWDDVNERAGADQGIAELASIEPAFDAELVIDCYDWSRWHHVIDVGGNNGAMLGAILHAHPQLKGTLLDLPKFADLGHRTMRHWEVGERVSVLPGSFFEPLPDHGDVYLLSAILADWADEQAVEILRRCGRAAGPTGRVLLAEVHLTDHEDLEPPLRTAMAVRLEASITEPDRTVDELLELADRAGLDLTWRGPATRVRSLLELRPREHGAQA